jgi:D-amino-acid oxidase
VDVTVVGAGVIGLVTALALEQDGHRVRIVAMASGAKTTSDIAGAVWFPYRVGPPDRVALWAAQTRTWLEQYADDPATGVDVLTGYEITNELGEESGTLPPRPWWAAHIEVTRAPAPVVGSPLAWKFSAPRVEPAVFLPWLATRLTARVEERVITDLASEPGDAVINCTGLGSRALVGDRELVALYGQIAIAHLGGIDPRVTITDNRGAEIFYLIPRRNEIVLGGCSLPRGADAPIDHPGSPDTAITERILAQASALGLLVGAMTKERTGLRPFRPTVRLERDSTDARIIHNYGHGGAGFTLCRGCADEVVRLVRA